MNQQAEEIISADKSETQKKPLSGKTIACIIASIIIIGTAIYLIQDDPQAQHQQRLNILKENAAIAASQFNETQNRLKELDKIESWLDKKVAEDPEGTELALKKCQQRGEEILNCMQALAIDDPDQGANGSNSLNRSTIETQSVIPKYNIESRCKDVASVGGGNSEVVFGECLNLEQTTYDDLKRDWGSFSQSVIQHCNEIATASSPGSYILLAACIKLELSAGAVNKQKKFKY